jgi:translation initiation factor 2 subunit 2
MASLSKQKKKKKAKTGAAEGGAESAEGAAGAAAEGAAAGGPSWASSDRDYTYTELLDRVMKIVQLNNPSLVERKRHVLPLPQIVRVGTRRTMWSNFAQTAQLMRRSPEHVMSFITTELGAECSLDASQRLVIKGRFLLKHAESVLRSYIREYVTCMICKNPETTLTRDSVTRLYFLQCESCGATRSVAPIKSGFHATMRAERRRAAN